MINVSNGQDFRNTKWGMSVEETKGTQEGDPTTSNDSNLTYAKQGYMGYTGDFEFHFKHNQLVSGKYKHGEHHTVKNLYLGDYEKIKAQLIKDFGQAKSDEKVWNDEKSPYKTTPTMWGHAIQEGTLEYWTKFESPTANIVLSMTGSNYVVSVVVEYIGKYTVNEPKGSGNKKKGKKKKK